MQGTSPFEVEQVFEAGWTLSNAARHGSLARQCNRQDGAGGAILSILELLYPAA